MIRRFLIKFIALSVLAVTVIGSNSIGASAEWKQDSTGWWYADGNSWYTGWKLIDRNWYYFYSNGYMAKDITIDGYYLNSSGAWINAVLTLDEAKNIVETLPKDYVKYFGSNMKYYYTPNDNYVDKTLRGKYYIFSYGDGEDLADNDICVDKFTGEIYIAIPNSNPSTIMSLKEFTKYIDEMIEKSKNN